MRDTGAPRDTKARAPDVAARYQRSARRAAVERRKHSPGEAVPREPVLRVVEGEERKA
jgi:hypothetical protein